jgi:cytochrome c-type biogenesis protein CcmH/NrfF
MLNRPGSPSGDFDRAAITAAEISNVRMLEIERRFMCPCGNCGEMKLTECNCEVPGGALEMKTAIARALEHGTLTDEIVGTVAEQFGGLKPVTATAAQEDTTDATVSAGNPAERYQPGLQSSHSGETRAAALMDVVSRFDCPCGNCSLSLLDCTCDERNGAVEIMAFIRDRLGTGATADEVAWEVEQRYGGRRQ